MSYRRFIIVLAGALATVLAGTLALVGPAQAHPNQSLPNKVVVRDGTTSPAAVDISKVTIRSSWYWDSMQSFSVKVPGKLRPGQTFTIWFNLDGDKAPEGRVIAKIKPKSAKYYKVKETFYRGGWSGGTKKKCLGDQYFFPVFGEHLKRTRTLSGSMDVWDCFGVKKPKNIDKNPGRWQVVAKLTKGGQGDMAPSKRKWSRAVRGWGPCDPSGGSCP